MLDNNPIPAITGRVCPHFCEQKCNRADFDESVSINSVERFMGDYILENASRMFAPPETDVKKKVAIVGSGPAGLSAAYYLRRLGYRSPFLSGWKKPGECLPTEYRPTGYPRMWLDSR